MGEKDEHTLLLGEIKGKLDMVIGGQKETNEQLSAVDARLRKVETKAAVNGAVAGGIISVGMALLIEKVKVMTGLNG